MCWYLYRCWTGWRGSGLTGEARLPIGCRGTHKPCSPHGPSEPLQEALAPPLPPQHLPGRRASTRKGVHVTAFVPAAPHRPRTKMEGANGKGLGSGSKGGTRTSLRLMSPPPKPGSQQPCLRSRPKHRAGEAADARVAMKGSAGDSPSGPRPLTSALRQSRRSGLPEGAAASPQPVSHSEGRAAESQRRRLLGPGRAASIGRSLTANRSQDPRARAGEGQPVAAG